MSSNAQIIWNFLKREGFSDCGAAGLMGNLDAESALQPNNLQNSYNTSLGLSDEEYTKRVDNGTYTNFVYDSAGYGLAQWTYWSRKQNLLNYIKNKGKSIGDLTSQLEFLVKELKENYTNSVYNVLKNATSIQEASNAVLFKFENPAVQNISVQNTRIAYGQKYYNQFTKGEISNMATNTYAKGTNVKLSTNFSSKEFDCHGNGCCSQTLINPQLIKYLQQIRDHFNKPITVTSGYRCLVHNRNVGGATGSRHSKGDAADIVVQGVAPREVAKYAESIGVKGIGLYETQKDGYFTHIDTRDIKSFWYGQACAPRSTFGGSAPDNSSSSSTPTTTTTTAAIYRYGSTDSEVANIQKQLIDLGYDVGSSNNDGIYGAQTVNAVKRFQKDHNLVIDGIMGPATIAELNKLSQLSSSYKGIVTASLLNVRSENSTNSKIVAQLQKNTPCVISKTENNWGYITSPVTGWVFLDYVKKV